MASPDLSVSGQPLSGATTASALEGDASAPPLPASAAALLGKYARAAISDGRVFYGELVGFDRDQSLLLRSADEYAPPRESAEAAAGDAEKAAGERKSAWEGFSRGRPTLEASFPGDEALVFRRNVDDVMVPGAHLVSLALMDDEADGEEK